MSDFLKSLTTVYTKDKLEINNDIGLNIALTKVLIKNSEIASKVKQIASYLFYISPLHYFYLLYFVVPKKQFIPRTLKIEKESPTTESDDKILLQIQSILSWSSREVNANLKVLKKTILANKSYWKKEFGIK